MPWYPLVRNKQDPLVSVADTWSWWGGVWQVEPGLEAAEGWLVGVLGGEGDGVNVSSEEVDCSDGMSLLVPLRVTSSEPQ